MSRNARVVWTWAVVTVLVGCGDPAERASDADAPAHAALAAASVDAALGSGAPEIRELTIRTRDYAFDAPARVPSGATRIRLVNEGPDFHHVWLIRLSEGHTIGELIGSLQERAVTPDWAVDVGGPNTPGAPGASTSAVVDLKPGSYGLVCLIPGPDGVLHIMKGMVRELTVEAAVDPAPLPEAELVMTMDDYSFAMSGPIRAGRRTIRVENVAAQAHEVVIVRLRPGKRAEDFLQFLGTREGTPPGRMIGGATGLSRGVANVITVAFEPGTYAFLCFVHDAADGRPHFMHGMLQTFEVV